MRDVLDMIMEFAPQTEKLNDEQIVEIYKATTEEEAMEYMETIKDLLENEKIPENISDLCMAVSYLNIEAFVFKNWKLPPVNL